MPVRKTKFKAQREAAKKKQDRKLPPANFSFIPQRLGYSYLSATIGSTFVARRPGK